MYTVQCTLYIVHCTLYTVHCTLYIVHCIKYTERSAELADFKSFAALRTAINFLRNPPSLSCQQLYDLSTLLLVEAISQHSSVPTLLYPNPPISKPSYIPNFHISQPPYVSPRYRYPVTQYTYIYVYIRIYTYI